MINQKIVVNCDFKISKNCKKEYSISKSYAAKNKKDNNGKYRCLYCGIEATHLGSKSHYFKFEKNDNFFQIIDSDLKAYMLGVICGDGHISKRNNLLEIVANINDRETIDLFNSNLLINNTKELVSRRNCYYFHINSKQICEDVCKHLNVPRGKKSHLVSLPKFNNDVLTWAFIRGFFDTDGCVSSIYAKQQSPRCFCSSTSPKILEEIKEFCNMKGIECSITGFKLNFNGKKAILLMQNLYNNDGSALSRKKNMFKKWEPWAPKLSGRRVSRRRKLTTEQINSLRFDVSEKLLTMRQIAKKYNISTATLHGIKIGETYKEQYEQI